MLSKICNTDKKKKSGSKNIAQQDCVSQTLVKVNCQLKLNCLICTQH